MHILNRNLSTFYAKISKIQSDTNGKEVGPLQKRTGRINSKLED